MTAIRLPTTQVTGILSNAPAMAGQVYGVGVKHGSSMIQVLVIAANGDALANAVNAVWAIDKPDLSAMSEVLVVPAKLLHPVAGPTAQEIQAWLREVADPGCRNCDGTGLFYGDVHICPCVNSPKETHTRFRYDPDDDKL